MIVWNFLVIFLNSLLCIWLQPDYYLVNLAALLLVIYFVYQSAQLMWQISLLLTAFWLVNSLPIALAIFLLGLVQFYIALQWQSLIAAKQPKWQLAKRLTALSAVVGIIFIGLTYMNEARILAFELNRLAIGLVVMICFGMFIYRLSRQGKADIDLD